MPPRRTAAAANEDKCTSAQKPSAQHSELQRTVSMLLASLVEAFQEDARRLDDDLHVSILDFIEQVEVADDLTPLMMEKMNKVAKSQLARFETKNAASVSKATSAPKGFRGGGDRRGARDPSTIQCNECAQWGHGWLTCPTGNKEMQKKELARQELARREESDTAKDARNASRAFGRAQREEEVSENEGYEDESEAGASVNRDTYSVGSVSFFIPSSTCTRSQRVRTPSSHALNIALSFCTRKSTKIYPRSLHDPKTTLTSESDWSVNKIVPLTCTPPLHASDHITILSQSREALPSSNKLLTFRSPAHGNSIVHMYPIQCVLNNPNVGAVLDTGTQRSVAKHPEEILRHTKSSHTMQGAFVKPTTMRVS